MASLQLASSLLISSSSSSSCSCSSKRLVKASINLPKLPNNLNIPKLPTKSLLAIEEFSRRNGFAATIPIVDQQQQNSAASVQLYAILEAIADRVEMHDNIGEQRNNWNNLLLNSINMITLAATTMAGVAATGALGAPLLALNLSSTLLFSAATGMLVIMNKIQPSQLAEEQRNASRLFKQLLNEVKTILALRTPTEADVNDVTKKILSLDRAYPLPLLGTMIEKFPDTFEPAVWWPNGDSTREPRSPLSPSKLNKNGWSVELEQEMRHIISVLKTKDSEDYKRLGNLALKVNKTLAISGPLLTGIAAVGSAFVGTPHGSSWAAVAAVVGGALGGAVTSLEHGGQVGMVLEMYRNCAGFFGMLQDSIESTLEERDVDKRENGEVFEMKIALKLGRSLSQLRDLASKSASIGSPNQVDEFASKLF